MRKEARSTGWSNSTAGDLPATEIGATNAPTYAKQQGQKTGQDMAVLGFNADFAPDVDVQ